MHTCKAYTYFTLEIMYSTWPLIKRIYGESVQHILCCWHVDQYVNVFHKDPKRHLKAMQSDSQQNLYQTLSLLEGETDATTFHLMMTIFLDYLKDKAPECISCSEQYYVHRPGNYNSYCIYVQPYTCIRSKTGISSAHGQLVSIHLYM